MYRSNNFYSRSPCGERLVARLYMYRSNNFYPRSPCGERHAGSHFDEAGIIFLSTLSLRRATGGFSLKTGDKAFLSTLSLRRATSNSGRIFRETPNFYPRSPCGERPAQLAASQAAQNISIHALLAESDGSERILWPVMRNFYPRSPCGERPTTATTCVAIANFYPRSPCGERQKMGYAERLKLYISIHALLAESDTVRLCAAHCC